MSMNAVQLMMKTVSRLSQLPLVAIKTAMAARIQASHTPPERMFSPCCALFFLTLCRYGNGDFVRHGAGSRDDDPFSSPSKNIRHRGNGNQRSVNTTPTRRLDLSWRSGSSDSSHGDSSPTKNVTISQQHSGAGLHSKEAITGQNAQAFYPPSACVFVAKYIESYVYFFLY